MKLDRLFADGQELIVQKRIGKGGEGEVYSLSNVPGFALKAYLPTLAKERESKIRAMVRSKLSGVASSIAFPYQVVVDARGEFVGFMMHLVEKHKEIHELQTPASRQKHFPEADYRFLVRTAINIARVFSQAHAAGCVVGDINQRSILVSPNATVALIDADSFQILHDGNRYLCVVGVPEYTPPELQGKSLKNVVRTSDHDAFGLAVSLFQLLCMDRHPFSGRYKGRGEMPLEKAIGEFRFAYSDRPTDMDAPPGSVKLQDFPTGIRDCFEHAFSPQYVGRRPSPTRWTSALEELEKSLRVCARNKLHHYSRYAAECPWCRMEAEFGRPIFLNADFSTSAINMPKGRVDDKVGLVLDVQSLLAAINSVPVPTSVSLRLPNVSANSQPSQTAKDLKRGQRVAPLQKALGVAVLAGAGLLALAYQALIIVALGMGAFGAWLLFRDESPGGSLFRDHGRLDAEIKKRVEQLQNSSPIVPVLEKKARALDAIDEYKRLSASYGGVEAEYDKRRMQVQLDAHLSGHSLRGARIDKISSADRASLASYGIATAFDAKKRNLQQAYGIGPVKAASITAWVRRVEAQFHFKKDYTQEDKANIRKSQLEIIAKQQGVEDLLKRCLEDFRQAAKAFEDWKRSEDSGLRHLLESIVQVETDLNFLGQAAPNRTAIPPYPVPNVDQFRARSTQPYTAYPNRSPINTPSIPTGTAPNCPHCRGTMVRRYAKRGPRAGQSFWGCRKFPSCTGTRPI